MAYNEKLPDRIRQQFAGLAHVEEKPMMGRLTFMYNGKMYIGIIKDALMCRINPALQDMTIAKKGRRTMTLPTGQ